MDNASRAIAPMDNSICGAGVVRGFHTICCVAHRISGLELRQAFHFLSLLQFSLLRLPTQRTCCASCTVKTLASLSPFRELVLASRPWLDRAFPLSNAFYFFVRLLHYSHCTLMRYPHRFSSPSVGHSFNPSPLMIVARTASSPSLAR